MESSHAARWSEQARKTTIQCIHQTTGGTPKDVPPWLGLSLGRQLYKPLELDYDGPAIACGLPSLWTGPHSNWRHVVLAAWSFSSTWIMAGLPRTLVHALDSILHASVSSSLQSLQMQPRLPL